MSHEDAALSAFAAGFTIWLAVRIINRREKWAIRTGIAWAIALVLALLVNRLMAYVDSIA